jgi:hypothetical protein
MDLKATGEGADYINLVQGWNMSQALVKKLMNLQLQ